MYINLLLTLYEFYSTLGSYWPKLTLNWSYINLNYVNIFSASEAFDSTYPTNVVVTSEGTCTYIPPGWFVWKLTTKVNFKYFVSSGI